MLAHMSNGDLCEWLPFARNLAGKVSSSSRSTSAATEFSGAPGGLTGSRWTSRRPSRQCGASAPGRSSSWAPRWAGSRRSWRPRTSSRRSLYHLGPRGDRERLDALPSAPRLRVPALYVAAEQDQNDPYDFAADAQRLFEATGSPDKRLELVPGALHGVFLVNGSAPVRALLERFSRDPRAAVRT